MINLLKADFYKLVKNKATYIAFIVCILLSLFTVLLYKAIASMGEAVGGFNISAKALMFGAFALSTNTGLLIPIFAGIFTISDVRHGTIRNKILFGENRTKVYLSHLIVSACFSVVSAIISFLTLAISGIIFFEYGASFSADELWNFIRCFIIGILGYVFIASISVFFALVTKSTPLTCVLTLLIAIGLGILANVRGFVEDKFEILFNLMPSYASTIVSQSGNISGELFAYGVGSFLFFITLNTIGGIILFKRLDLK